MKRRKPKVGDYIYWKSKTIDTIWTESSYPNGDYGIITKIDEDEDITRYWAKWYKDKWGESWVHLRDIKIILTKEEFYDKIMIDEL